MKRLLAPLAVLSLLACSDHYIHPRAASRAVQVPAGHACTETCPHYRAGSTFYEVQGHRHGAGCGHRLRDGVWVEAD